MNKFRIGIVILLVTIGFLLFYSGYSHAGSDYDEMKIVREETFAEISAQVDAALNGGTLYRPLTQSALSFIHCYSKYRDGNDYLPDNKINWAELKQCYDTKQVDPNRVLLHGTYDKDFAGWEE